MAVKVTLDTNCFFDYSERKPDRIQDLINLQTQGDIEIAMTTRVMADTLDKWKGGDTSPIWKKIQLFPIFETVGSAFRLGISRLDSGDYLSSDSDSKAIDDLQKIMLNAQAEDVDHIFGHINAKRDLFVTSDSHFLNHKEDLKDKFGVNVLKPEEAIQVIRKKIGLREFSS
jgi:hypothetical protein